MYGHIFEVTPTGNLAWEYVNPIMTGNYVSETLGFNASGAPIVGGAAYAQNSVFRSHRYAADYPGLAGKTLGSHGTISSPAIYTGFSIGATGVTGGGGSSGGGGGGDTSGFPAGDPSVEFSRPIYDTIRAGREYTLPFRR